MENFHPWLKFNYNVNSCPAFSVILPSLEVKPERNLLRLRKIGTFLSIFCPKPNLGEQSFNKKPFLSKGNERFIFLVLKCEKGSYFCSHCN